MTPNRAPQAEQLCRAGMAAVDDGSAMSALTRCQSRRAASSALRDAHHEVGAALDERRADHLRLQILIALEAMKARLALLEALPRA